MILERKNIDDKPAGIKRPGRTLIFTGDGKGKTTAALGMALRACGHGQKVFIVQFLKSGNYDLVILDEIGTAILKGVLAEEKVLEIIRRKAEKTSLVLTGRGISDRLMKQADTITRMDCLKHGLKQGLKAQVGIEY